MKRRDPLGGVDLLTLDSRVYNGVHYLTFTAMSNKTFKDSYTWPCMIRDILGIDEQDETWMNSNFENDWLGLKPYFMRKIENHKGLPIVLSGHGVAGALAVIAGYHLTMRNKKPLRVVTFGAPQALNSYKTNNILFEEMQDVTTQYVLKNDPMPKMFRWTKYTSVNRTVLDMRGVTCGMGDYLNVMNTMERGGLL